MSSNLSSPSESGVLMPIRIPSGVPLELERYFKHHSRSFSFAARFFAPEDRPRVCRLYAFCRVTDDIVDEAGRLGHGKYDAREALATWKRLVRRSYDGESSGIEWLDVLMRETRATETPFGVVEALFDGVESDLDGVRVSNESELETYAYRVGSIVGIWMCQLLGVRSQRMHDFAAALGSAMQITNILRDVGQDLDTDRMYIPATLLSRYDLTLDDISEMKRAGKVDSRYVSLLRHLMDIADSRYEQAWEGLVRLPSRFGLAAAIASGVYRGIHREIVRNGFDNLTRRARTSGMRKLVLAVTSWCRLREMRRHLAAAPASNAEKAVRSSAKFSPLTEKGSMNHSFRD